MGSLSASSSAIIDDSRELASWARPRSLTELRSFVSTHDEALDLEDFDL